MLGLERKHLARRAQISPSLVGYIENGGEKNNVTLEKVDDIARALRTPPWTLLLPTEIFLAGKDAHEQERQQLSKATFEHDSKTREAAEVFDKLDENGQRKAVEYFRDLLELQQAKAAIREAKAAAIIIANMP